MRLPGNQWRLQEVTAPGSCLPANSYSNFLPIKAQPVVFPLVVCVRIKQRSLKSRRTLELWKQARLLVPSLFPGFMLSQGNNHLLALVLYSRHWHGEFAFTIHPSIFHKRLSFRVVGGLEPIPAGIGRGSVGTTWTDRPVRWHLPSRVSQSKERELVCFRTCQHFSSLKNNCGSLQLRRS